jgi:hypothetical protein
MTSRLLRAESLKSRVALTILVILGGLAAGAVLLATPHGLGLGSDSAVYVAAGRNLVAGRGLSWLSGGGESGR